MAVLRFSRGRFSRLHILFVGCKTALMLSSAMQPIADLSLSTLRSGSILLDVGRAAIICGGSFWSTWTDGLTDARFLIFRLLAEFGRP